MEIQVLLFAVARERVGRDKVSLTLPAGTTVAELRQRLAEEFPPLADILPRSMIAIDEEYAAEEDELSAGIEVACIPPVSGGSGLT